MTNNDNIKEYGWDESTTPGNFLYYEQGTGRIVGEVSRVGMIGARSSASSYIDVNNAIYLGNYIDSAWAKLAVERHQNWYDNNIDNQIDYEPN